MQRAASRLSRRFLESLRADRVPALLRLRDKAVVIGDRGRELLVTLGLLGRDESPDVGRLACWRLLAGRRCQVRRRRFWCGPFDVLGWERDIQALAHPSQDFLLAVLGNAPKFLVDRLGSIEVVFLRLVLSGVWRGLSRHAAP